MEKTNTELLILLKHYYEEHESVKGLCRCVLNMKVEGDITSKEADFLDVYIQNNCPPDKSRYDFFWPVEDRKSRLEWLNHNIELEVNKVSHLHNFNGHNLYHTL